MKTWFKLTLVWLTLICATTANAVEIKMGENKIICEHPQVGSFEMHFTVKDVIVDTEYYSDSVTPPTPSWEILESELIQVTFTSGKWIVPSDTTGVIEGATIKVVRNVFKGATDGLTQAFIHFSEESQFPLRNLMLDHNHPEKYKTEELGAQTFGWFGQNLIQLFFTCK